jgi:hypothetical protein
VRRGLAETLCGLLLVIFVPGFVNVYQGRFLADYFRKYDADHTVYRGVPHSTHRHNIACPSELQLLVQRGPDNRSYYAPERVCGIKYPRDLIRQRGGLSDDVLYLYGFHQLAHEGHEDAGRAETQQGQADQGKRERVLGEAEEGGGAEAEEGQRGKQEGAEGQVASM